MSDARLPVNEFLHTFGLDFSVDTHVLLIGGLLIMVAVFVVRELLFPSPPAPPRVGKRKPR